MAEITSVTLGGVSLSCMDVKRPRRARVGTHIIPGRASPQTQIVAGVSNTITLKGRLFGADKETDKATLEGFELSTVTYNDTENGTLSVFVENVDIPHDANIETTYRNFNITLRIIT